MNFSSIKTNLNFLKYCDNEDFFRKLKLYEEIFFVYQKVHNISNYKSLELEIIDSLKVLDFKDFAFAKTIIDVGSGAGFPAIFLALVLNSSFYLFEPSQKKAAFLFLVKSELGLENLIIKKERIQDSKESFKADLISSRAFSKINDLLRLCVNFYDENSLFLLYKGSRLEEELESLKNYEIFEYEKRKYCFFSPLQG